MRFTLDGLPVAILFKRAITYKKDLDVTNHKRRGENLLAISRNVKVINYTVEEIGHFFI